MTEDSGRQWWSFSSYSKEEQKRRIEDAVDEFLSRPRELTDRQKLFLRDAIGHAYRGLFGMAAQDLHLFGLPESVWSDSAGIEPAMVAGVTRETLRRALEALRRSPVQAHPIFM